MIKANDPNKRAFLDIASDSDFPIQNLPFGVFSTQQLPARVGVAIGEWVLDLQQCVEKKLLTGFPVELFAQSNLNGLMAKGRQYASNLRNSISDLLSADNPVLRDNHPLQQYVLIPMADVTMHLPAVISSYTDFYSSKEHASNIGAMFRDKDNPLLPNWVHLPVAYDGRAGSVVVSGTNFHRPKGQLKPDPEAPPVFSPCKAMDVEVEMGFLIGRQTHQGDSISTDEAEDYIFGMVLVNDWSARDIQKWEYVPLGPFLGKNFCTSISPWVVTIDALEPFRVASPKQDPEPLPYLQRRKDWGIDIQLELALQAEDMQAPQTVANMNFKNMYWDICQQLAHHTINGCPMYTGDLLASGTISNTDHGSYGSLIELTWGGQNPIRLNGSGERKFLQDGDTAIIRGYCQGDGYRVGFGEVRGTVLPAK